MLAGYSQEVGILQGARDTFSGEKPCELCCKIAAAERKDEGNDKPAVPNRSKELSKLVQEMVPHECLEELGAPLSRQLAFVRFREVVTIYCGYVSHPPKQPPRGFV